MICGLQNIPTLRCNFRFLAYSSLYLFILPLKLPRAEFFEPAMSHFVVNSLMYMNKYVGKIISEDARREE